MIAVARNSLGPIWSWLCQDLIPTDARSFVFQAKGAAAYTAPPRALTDLRSLQRHLSEHLQPQARAA